MSLLGYTVADLVDFIYGMLEPSISEINVPGEKMLGLELVMTTFQS